MSVAEDTKDLSDTNLKSPRSSGHNKANGEKSCPRKVKVLILDDPISRYVLNIL